MSSVRIPLPDGCTIERGAYAVMAQLATHGSMRAGQLAGDLGVDFSTVSRQLSLLTTRGYVRKDVDPADGRAAVLSLTDSGQQLMVDGAAIRQEFLARLLSDWDDEEISTFAQLLERFNNDAAAHRGRRRGELA